MKKVSWMKDGILGVGTLEATEGERSEPQGAVRVSDAPDPEVPEKPRRRKFSAQYKLRVLQLADSCTEPGSLGRLLRREGLYSSNLTTWRRQRDKGILQGLQPVKRGRKPSGPNPLLPELERLADRALDVVDRHIEGGSLPAAISILRCCGMFDSTLIRRELDGREQFLCDEARAQEIREFREALKLYTVKRKDLDEGGGNSCQGGSGIA